MKITFLYQYFSTPQMTGQIYAYEMARRLVAHGHEVHMVTSDRTGRGRGWYETQEAGIRVHWYPVEYSNHMGYNRRIRAFLQFALAAGRKAARLPADLLYVSSPPLTMALPGAYLARKKRIPMVFEVVDLWPEMPVAVGALKNRPAIAAARWMERLAYRHAAHVIAFSPGMKAGVVSAGYPPEKVTVVPNVSDVRRFRIPEEVGRQLRSRHTWLQDRPLVVYTGTLGIINGVDYLARLAAAVRRRDPEIRFLVVGSGREEDKVRRTAKELGVLEETFFMWPSVPKADVPAVLSAADLATSVFLDVREMWNNCAAKVFDALAAGRPIAINYQGWQAEMIGETGCGLVLDPHDVPSAADRLVAGIRDARWLLRARNAARRVGEEQFERDKLARRWESAVLGVVAQGQTRAAA
jgi:glycosyltransferase involved in cell wall biosynthesis